MMVEKAGKLKWLNFESVQIVPRVTRQVRWCFKEGREGKNLRFANSKSILTFKKRLVRCAILISLGSANKESIDLTFSR
jgi:hypothetical protein